MFLGRYILFGIEGIKILMFFIFSDNKIKIENVLI